VSDRFDRPWVPWRPAALVALAAAAGLLVLTGCPTHDPLVVPPDGGVPCTRAAAIASDTVVIAALVCNPSCIHVKAGTPVYFINHDPFTYYLVADPPLPYDLSVPPYAGTVTLPLAAGTVTWTAPHQPSAAATIFVE